MERRKLEARQGLGFAASDKQGIRNAKGKHTLYAKRMIKRKSPNFQHPTTRGAGKIKEHPTPGKEKNCRRKIRGGGLTFKAMPLFYDETPEPGRRSNLKGGKGGIKRVRDVWIDRQGGKRGERRSTESNKVPGHRDLGLPNGEKEGETSRRGWGTEKTRA